MKKQTLSPIRLLSCIVIISLFSCVPSGKERFRTVYVTYDKFMALTQPVSFKFVFTDSGIILRGWSSLPPGSGSGGYGHNCDVETKVVPSSSVAKFKPEYLVGNLRLCWTDIQSIQRGLTSGQNVVFVPMLSTVDSPATAGHAERYANHIYYQIYTTSISTSNGLGWTDPATFNTTPASLNPSPPANQ